MKVKIIKKQIKEGVTDKGAEYKITSLFVSLDDDATYNRIVSYLQNDLGATPEQIDKFLSVGEFEGNLEYKFNLTCSHYTFERVEQFGYLDTKVGFNINSKGYINARIPVQNRREMVNGYEPPLSQVEGWFCEPEFVEKQERNPFSFSPQVNTPTIDPDPKVTATATPPPPPPVEPLLSTPFFDMPEEGDDLPF